MAAITAAIASAWAAFTAATTISVGGLSIGIGSILVKTAFSVATSLLQKAFAGKSGSGPAFGIEGKVQAGGEVPRSIMLGLGATAGSLVYHNQWGTFGKVPNAYYTRVTALSDVPVDSLSGLFVNGVRVTLLTGEADADKGIPVDEFRVSGRDHLWVKFYDGTQVAADAFLTGTVSTTERPWASTDIGTGVAYAVTTCLFDRDLFSGFPDFLFELQGMPLYDITKDSTAGGSGSHRWDTPSTWGGDGDDLPAVQIYNLLRGISYDGDWLYGFQGVTAAQLRAADWIAAIDLCRATDVLGDPGIATYVAGGELTVSTQVRDAIEALQSACAGKIADVGGVFVPRVGPPPSSSASITDGDIVITAPQGYVPFPGLSDSINGIEASYPEPDEGWTMRPAPALLDSTLEAEDQGIRLTAKTDLPMVYTAERVQYLMQAALAEARRFRRHAVVVGPAFWEREPGETVAWTSTRHGYSAKLFRIEGVSILPAGWIAWDLVEVDPADYDWTRSTDYTAPTLGTPAIVTGSGRLVREDIAPGEVTGRHLRLHQSGNLVPDAAIVDEFAWTIPANWSHEDPVNLNWRSSGGFFYDFPGGSGFSGEVVSTDFPVEAGSTYFCGFQTRQVTGTQHTVRGRIEWLDNSGTTISHTNIANDLSTETGSVVSWTNTRDAPTGAKTARFKVAVDLDNTDGDVRVGGPFVRERVRAGDLRDGSVERVAVLDGAISDKGLETDATTYATTNTSFEAAGTTRITLSDLGELDTIIVNWAAEIRSTVGGTTARAALYYRSRPMLGTYSGWSEVNPNNPTRFGNGSTSFVAEAASAVLPAPDEQVQFAIWHRSEGGGSVEIQEQRLRPLVVRR